MGKNATYYKKQTTTKIRGRRTKVLTTYSAPSGSLLAAKIETILNILFIIGGLLIVGFIVYYLS